MDETIIIENAGFSYTHWSQLSLDEFISEGMQLPKLFTQYEPEDKKKVLQQAYNIIHGLARAT